MDANALIAGVRPFLEYLVEWEAGLPSLPLRQFVGEPERVAVISVDVINGFCTEGPLASPRVNGIVGPVADLLARAWEAGVRAVALVQEGHEPEALEFGAYPPHCVRGSSQAEAPPAIKALPFFGELPIVRKNSVSPFAATELGQWVADRPGLDTFVVVGDCTDICTYQLAMGLHTEALARQVRRRVIVPADCVETYDLAVEVARRVGGAPHHGDLHHLLFLHHMHQNGIEVVRRLA